MVTLLTTKPPHKSLGFSMLEVLITMAVVSVSLVALAKFQGDLMQSSSLAKNRTIAINLAQDQMEILRSTDFADLADGSDTIGPSDSADIEADVSEYYARSWSIVVDGANAAVDVTVTWTDYTTADVSDNTKIALFSNISSSAASDSGKLMDPPPP